MYTEKQTSCLKADLSVNRRGGRKKWSAVAVMRRRGTSRTT